MILNYRNLSKDACEFVTRMFRTTTYFWKLFFLGGTVFFFWLQKRSAYLCTHCHAEYHLCFVFMTYGPWARASPLSLPHTHWIFPSVNCSTLYHFCTYGQRRENWDRPKFVIRGMHVGQHWAQPCRQDAVQSVCMHEISPIPRPPGPHQHAHMAGHWGLLSVRLPCK